jgi:aspartyl/asparaginyl beta-hydroxylase (cupin superfamily)
MSTFSDRVEGLASKAVVWTRPFAERVVVKTAKHGNPAVYQTADFPEFRILENNWKVIRRELEGVLDERKRLPTLQDISPVNVHLTRDEHWRIYMLYSYGERIEENCVKCPETTRLVEQIPGMKTAMFSILSPGKHIPAHRGPYNGVLRYHLGLIIPEPREKCRIRVGSQYCTWEEGKGLVFDDSYEHEVWNDTEGQRVVLFITFDRPLKFPGSIFNWGINKLHELSTYHQEPLRRLKEYR